MSTAVHDSTLPPSTYWQGLFSLPRSIWMPIIAMSIIAIGAFFFNEWSVRRIESSAATLALLTSAHRDLAEFQTRVVDAETGQRGFLLSHDPQALVRYEESLVLLTVVGERLRLFAANDPELLLKVQKLEALRAQEIAHLRATLVLAQQNRSEDAAVIARTAAGAGLMDDFRSAANELRGVLEIRVTNRLAETARNAQLTRVAFAALTLLLLLLLFVAVRLLVTDYWRQESARREQTDERQRLEHLVAERTAELSNLTAHLQTAAEKDKATLARDLHDEFGGLLTAAKMDLAWLQGRASAKEPEAHAKLAALASLLDEAMDVKRRVVENLRPALLDHFGLPAALQSYFEDTCKKAGINFTARVPDDFEQLNQDLAIALFRVGQESLTNILKHAKAENVELTLMLDDGQLPDPDQRRWRGNRSREARWLALARTGRHASSHRKSGRQVHHQHERAAWHAHPGRRSPHPGALGDAQPCRGPPRHLQDQRHQLIELPDLVQEMIGARRKTALPDQRERVVRQHDDQRRDGGDPAPARVAHRAEPVTFPQLHVDHQNIEVSGLDLIVCFELGLRGCGHAHFAWNVQQLGQPRSKWSEILH